MRSFAYYLFEHFDAEAEADNPANPRRFLDARLDAAISAIVDVPTLTLTQSELEDRFGAECVVALLRGGIIRIEKGRVALNTPVLVHEDAAALRQFLAQAVMPLADVLCAHADEMMALTRRLSWPAAAPVHLYHVLCGMILDGAFLDALGTRGVMATERRHPDGLDYLATIYENDAALDALSAGLLCSYNRAVSDTLALQSFGDSDGARLDAYRFFRLRELGRLTPCFAEAERLAQGMTQADLLAETERLLKAGKARKTALALLNCLGYARGGRVCVPVYRAADQAVVHALAQRVEDWLVEPVCEALTCAGRTLDVLAVRHGVAATELANELWHLLFGSLNEELVRRGLAAKPLHREGEGRYLQSIQAQW